MIRSEKGSYNKIRRKREMGRCSAAGGETGPVGRSAREGGVCGAGPRLAAPPPAAPPPQPLCSAEGAAPNLSPLPRRRH